ncbi:MAG: glycosyltransferase family 39 protein [Anaerolineae bacterium]|nr:glycosyltransferase family 39 protein [Anaerolineae bacterium]MDW8101491.1 glycosyltransferase family 39 protein [Anaerolineae bacterium]
MRRSVEPYLILTFLFAIPLMGPLFMPGYFWNAHDARHNVFFIFELDRSIKDGLLYPRWSPDFAFGYGYPFFNIYGPLSSYLGELFHLLGFDIPTSVEIVFGLSILLSGSAMYLFLRKVMGPGAAFLGAMVYLYAPYHIFDLYVRAALAEAVSMVFIPLVFWGIYESVERPRWNAVAGTAIAYALLLFTSNLVALVVTPMLALYLLLLTGLKAFSGFPRERFSLPYAIMGSGEFIHVSIPPASGLLLGLALCAFFWLPAFFEFKYVRTDQWMGGYYRYQDHFVYFFQLFSPRWGFGISVAGPNDNLGFQLGIVPFGLTVLSLLVLPRLKGSLRAQAIFFFLATALTVFLSLHASTLLWEKVSFVRFAQFPWRWLLIPVFSMAFLSSLILAEERNRPFLPLLLGLMVIAGSYPYIKAEPGKPPEGGVSLAGLMRFQRTSNEMTGSTAWVKEIPGWSPFADLHIAGIEVKTRIDYTSIPPDTQISTLEWRTASELFGYLTEREDLTVTLNLFYYPGWTAYLLEKEGEKYRIVKKLPIAPEDGPLGRVTVKVPKGLHYVLVRFEDTPVRKLGCTITWISVAFCSGVWLLRAWLRRRGRCAGSL